MIPGVIFLISFFVHNLFVYPYVKVQTDLISRQFRDIIYDKIKKDKLLNEEQKKVLWELTEMNDIKVIKVTEFMDFVRIFYIIACSITAIAAAIFMKWYMSNSDYIIIADDPDKKVKK